MVCPKKQQKLALQTKRLKLFNEGYNVIPPLSQESLVAIESMRRTLHFCWALEDTWLKLSRGSLNSLLPQHHDFFNDLCSTLPNQTKNSKPNGRSKPRRCKGSPASSAPILDEHLLKRMRILNDVAEIDKTTILYPLFCI